MPQLTIVTVTHNRAEMLKHNFESVLAQDFDHLEHIVVDNMSSDGTESIVRDYQQVAPYSVLYVREPDTGIYNAMNKGLKRARGIWTHVLNSDDRYFDAASLGSVFLHDLNPYDLVANAVCIADSEEPRQDRLWIPRYDPQLHWYFFPHPGLLIKSDFYKTHGYYNERFRIVADSVYGIEHYDQTAYVVLNTPLVTVSDGGISNRPSLRNLYETCLVILIYHHFPMRMKIALIRDRLTTYVNSRSRTRKQPLNP